MESYPTGLEAQRLPKGPSTLHNSLLTISGAPTFMEDGEAGPSRSTGGDAFLAESAAPGWIHEVHASGAKDHRARLEACLRAKRDGDVVVVRSSMGRLAALSPRYAAASRSEVTHGRAPDRAGRR